MITYQSIFTLAVAGFALMGLMLYVDQYVLQQAALLSARAKQCNSSHVSDGYAKAVRMVQHKHMLHARRAVVERYIDLLEQAHRDAGLGTTWQFDRLRQELTRNSCGLRVVV
jgi:hypothetical protein